MTSIATTALHPHLQCFQFLHYRYITEICVFEQTKNYFTFMTHKGEFEKQCHEDLMVCVSLWKGKIRLVSRMTLKQTQINCHCQGVAVALLEWHWQAASKQEGACTFYFLTPSLILIPCTGRSKQLGEKKKKSRLQSPIPRIRVRMVGLKLRNNC